VTRDDEQRWLNHHVEAWLTYENIWLVEFDANGRCRRFVEHYMKRPQRA
jgi:hypothetical protein